MFIIDKDKLNKFLKILVIIYISLSVVNLFLPDGISCRIYPEQELYQNGFNRFFAMLRWLNDISILCLPIAIFYKKKPFIWISCYFLSFVFIINLCFFNKYLDFYTNGYGEGIMNIRFFSENVKNFFVNLTFRSIYLAILFLLEDILITGIFVLYFKDLKIDTKRNVKNTLLILLGLFLAIMPIYAPQYLFGGYALDSDNWFTVFKLGTFQHILWIIFIPLEIFVLYKIFKKFSQEDRYIAMIIMSLALMYEFLGIYTCFGEIICQRYPFQLCNFAAIMMLPIVLSKNRTLQTFSLVVNGVGAFIAIALCDSAKAGFNYVMNVHYIVEHTKVVSIPILCSLLGIFPSINKKSIKDVIIGFTLYYAFVFIVGGIFTGIYDVTGNDYWYCNYLFMFNKEVTTSIVGFVGIFFDIKIVLFNFFTLSLIKLLIYVAFMAIIIGYFYLLLLIQKMYKKKKNKIVE